jgi:hypothetical protein
MGQPGGVDEQEGLNVDCGDSHLFLDFRDRKEQRITLTNTNSGCQVSEK